MLSQELFIYLKAIPILTNEENEETMEIESEQEAVRTRLFSQP